MNFILTNKNNKRLTFTNPNNVVVNSSQKNYVMNNKKTEVKQGKSTNLRNMFSLIKYAKTSCGSCSGVR